MDGIILEICYDESLSISDRKIEHKQWAIVSIAVLLHKYSTFMYNNNIMIVTKLILL